MAILKILQYPDLRLRCKGYRVGNVKAVKIQKTIKDMVETVLNAKSCGALAATQLDIDDPPKITVINKDVDHFCRGEALCLINPEVISSEDYTIEEEGCMSINLEDLSPVRVKVRRANKIKVKALDIDGNKLEFTAEGYFARCIQHECDHLEGVLNIDHLGKTDRQLFDKLCK